METAGGARRRALEAGRNMVEGWRVKSESNWESRAAGGERAGRLSLVWRKKAEEVDA